MRPSSSVLRLWFTASTILFCLLSSVLAQAQESGSVTLEWDPSPESNVSKYVVRYGTTSGKYDRAVNSGNQTTATLIGLEAGTKFYCAVFAQNDAGIESSPSNEITFETAALKPFVNIIGLANGEFRNSGASITLQADSSSDITRVEFYVGGVRVAESSAGTPFPTWTASNPGETVVVAKGYNAENEVTQSANIVVRVVKPAITAAQRRPNGAFSFLITGAPGRVQHVNASTDLITWTRIESAVNETGTMEFVDDDAGAMTKRFYRVESE